MKITLDTWERVQLGVIVGSGSAPTIEGVRLALKALDVINMSNEEKAEVGWIVPGPNQFGWTRKKEHELEFDDDVWQIVQVAVRAFQSWPIDERSPVLYDKVTA